MAAIDYCKNKRLPDSVKEALLDLVDRLDYYYYDKETNQYVGLHNVVADKLKYVHRKMDGGK